MVRVKPRNYKVGKEKLKWENIKDGEEDKMIPKRKNKE
jgi:hypothetical protein